MIIQFVDSNNNGQAELSELLAINQFQQDDGTLTFQLANAFSLPFGETTFLISYQFN